MKVRQTKTKVEIFTHRKIFSTEATRHAVRQEGLSGRSIRAAPFPRGLSVFSPWGGSLHPVDDLVPLVVVRDVVVEGVEVIEVLLVLDATCRVVHTVKLRFICGRTRDLTLATRCP